MSPLAVLSILAADVVALGALVALVGARTTGGLVTVLCGVFIATGVMYSLFPKEG
jgi:hypothetical protein